MLTKGRPLEAGMDLNVLGTEDTLLEIDLEIVVNPARSLHKMLAFKNFSSMLYCFYFVFAQLFLFFM